MALSFQPAGVAQSGQSRCSLHHFWKLDLVVQEADYGPVLLESSLVYPGTDSIALVLTLSL